MSHESIPRGTPAGSGEAPLTAVHPTDPAEAADAGFSLGVHGARGLFAFAVFVYHVHNSGLPGVPLPGLADAALSSLQYGVELFFAISGFVIAGTLDRARTPTAFIVNRATRIYPVLWTAVLLFVALSLATGEQLPAALPPLDLMLVTLGNMLALPDLVPMPLFLPQAWTLNYELCFYVFCFVYLVLLRRFSIRAEMPLLAFGIALLVFNPRGIFFLAGLIVSLGWLRGAAAGRLSRPSLLWLVVFLAAWAAVWSKDEPFTSILPWFGDLRIVFAVVAFVAATLCLEGVVRGSGLLGRLLATPLLQWLGTVSYSFYLWHPVVMAVVKRVMHALGLVDVAGEASQALFFLLALPPSLAVAAISRALLEDRAARALRRLASRRRLSPAHPVRPGATARP